MHECCGPFWGREKEHHGFHRRWSSPCFCWCCWGPASQAPLGFVRRFRTKEEKIAELEAYLEALKKEAQAVEEKIRRLREE